MTAKVQGDDDLSEGKINVHPLIIETRRYLLQETLDSAQQKFCETRAEEYEMNNISLFSNSKAVKL